MPEDFIWEKTATTREVALQVDAILKHDPVIETTLSDNPMEEGIDTTDHVVPRPGSFQVEAIISDRLADGTVQEGRALAAFETLERLARGVFLDVMVPFQGLVENVLLQRVSTSLGPELGVEVLRFSASFRRVRIGQSQQVPAPARREPKTKPTRDDGYKPPELVYAHTAERGRTLARRYLVDALSDRSRQGD